MKTKTNTRTLAVIATETIPDPAILQAGVDRRLAHRHRLSLPVAALVAGLAGIGPQAREARL